MVEDLLLVTGIRNGDFNAFGKLFRKYYSPLLYYAAGITGSLDTAEDIIQDLFFVIWRDRSKLNIFISAKSYLYRAVRNRAQQAMQRKGRETGLSQTGNNMDIPDPNASGDMEYKELEGIIALSMASMPRRRALIFRMHRFEEMKYKEIAKKLSLSVKTVEAEMTKALKLLKQEIEIHHQQS